MYMKNKSDFSILLWIFSRKATCCEMTGNHHESYQKYWTWKLSPCLYKSSVEYFLISPKTEQILIMLRLWFYMVVNSSYSFIPNYSMRNAWGYCEIFLLDRYSLRNYSTRLLSGHLGKHHFDALLFWQRWQFNAMNANKTWNTAMLLNTATLFNYLRELNVL